MLSEVAIKSLFFIILCFLFSCQQSGKESNIDSVKLDKYFSFLKDKKVASGSVLLLKSGEVAYENNYNFNQEIKKPIYRIGSVTKIYMAVIFLKMAEEGKLSLSDKLAKFYPQIDKANLITVEHLLRHRSGLPNMTSLSDYGVYSQSLQTESETIKRFSKYKVEFEPNSKYEYSNTGYVLLSYIAQKVSGKSFSELLNLYITQPLSLKNTFVYVSSKKQENEVDSFFKKAKWQKATNTHESVTLGAGAIASTPMDVALFLRALFTNRLVSEKSLEMMMEFDSEGEYGIGLLQFPYGDKIFYGHTGGVDGYATITGYNREDDLVIVSMANGLSFNFNDISIALLAGFYGDEFSMPQVEKTILVKKETLDLYNGTYGSKDFPLELTFKNEDGVLIGIASSSAQHPIPFEATSETQFKFPRASILLEFKDSGEKLIFTQGETIELKRLKK